MVHRPSESLATFLEHLWVDVEHLDVDLAIVVLVLGVVEDPVSDVACIYYVSHNCVTARERIARQRRD